MNNIKENWNIKSLISVIVCFLIVNCLSIVYAALNTEMMITGDVYVRVDADIRISNLIFLESSNEGYETYNSKYSKDTTSLFVTLPNSDSTVTYYVTITNQTTDDYILSEIIEESYTNTNVGYKIEDIEIFDEITGNTTKAFRITLYNKTQYSQQGTLVLKYKFEIDVVDPPGVSGGSTEWSTSRTFELTPPTSTSGIASYEYYISDSTTPPDATVTPTGSSTSTNITIEQTGKYIYFRAVNNNGVVGKWTTYQNLYVDTCSPDVAISGNSTSISNWTNSNVTLTAAVDDSSCICGIKSYQWYRNENSIDDETSNTYVAEDNNFYKVEVIMNNGAIASDETYTYIDKYSPTINEIEASSTYNSITLTIDSSDVGSGVGTYMVSYRKSGETAWKSTAWQDSNEITISNLEPGSTYELNVSIKDKAGNTTTKTSITENTVSFYMPELIVSDTYPAATYGEIKLVYDSSYVYEPDVVYEFTLYTVDGGDRIRESDYVSSGVGDVWGDAAVFEFYNDDFYNEMVLTLSDGKIGEEVIATDLITGDVLELSACTTDYSACQYKEVSVVIDEFAAPGVSGESTEWATSRTFELTPPSSVYGIASYEYYISKSTTTPSSYTTPTGTSESTSITISKTGKYIYFRAVNVNGKAGPWTTYKNLYVDTCNPTVNITGNSTSSSNWSADSLTLTVEDNSNCICGIESYQWYQDESSIEGATEATYLADTYATYSVVVTYNNGKTATATTKLYIDLIKPYVNSVTTSSTYGSIQLVVDAFDDHSGVASYMVDYKVSGTSSYKSTSWQTSNVINVTNLEPGNTYAFRVYVKDNVGRVTTKSTYYEETKSFYMPQLVVDASYGEIKLVYDSSYVYEPDAIYEFTLYSVDGGDRIRESDYVSSGVGDVWDDGSIFEFYNEDFYNEMVLGLADGETGTETLIYDLITGDVFEMSACTTDYSACQYVTLTVTVDETAPTTTAPTVTSSGTKITIVNNQTDENGLSSEHVYYKVSTCTGTSCWKIKNLSSSGIISSGIEAGTTYNIYTRSCDFAGNCSNSVTVNHTTEAVDTTPPTTTAPIIEVLDSRKIKVTNQQTDSESSIDTTKYRVDYKLTSETTWSSLASPDSRTATLTILTPNTTYDIRTYTCDSKGNCSTSTTVQATTRNYIWGCAYSNITYAGYTVTCNIDNTVTKVTYPSWTVYNGQDDLGTWPTATINSTTGTATYTVKTSDHNYESGDYVTHAYATSSELSSSVGVILSTVTIPDEGPYEKYLEGDPFYGNGESSKLVLEYTNTINPYVKVVSEYENINTIGSSVDRTNFMTAHELLTLFDEIEDYEAIYGEGGNVPLLADPYVFTISPSTRNKWLAIMMGEGADSTIYKGAKGGFALKETSNGYQMVFQYSCTSGSDEIVCTCEIDWTDIHYNPLIVETVNKE